MLVEIAHDHRSAHEALVDAWMARTAMGADRPRLIELLDLALEALWRRAQQTLGDVTVLVLVERVVRQSVRRHSVLRPLHVMDGRVSCSSLTAGDADVFELAEALQFVLVELLTVIGQLTAQILTPALHDELWRVADVAAPSAAACTSAGTARRA